jgi:hypothetical protein
VVAARALALCAVGAAAFALACGQAPLYYSNQNQYFLHGLAHAGVGLLGDDWLARTRDPTPLFSGLVAFTARYLHPWAFYVSYAVLQAAYAAGLLGVFFAVAGEPARRRWPVFVALLVAAHAALLRWASFRWLGEDYPWYLQAGVAGQYVLGGMLQPSVFGVLLVVAVGLFAHGRPHLATVSAALAATLHTTYLLPAGLLVLGFGPALLAERQTARAVGVGALALALVAPAAVFVLATFGPTDAAKFRAAQEVLAQFRIPHHTEPRVWLGLVAVAQVAWLMLGLALARPARLAWALTLPAALALLLSLAQGATGSDALALLFPWRLSAVLIPIATAVILARLVAVLPAPVEGPTARAVAAGVVLICAAGGVWVMAARQGYRTSDDELPLLDFVRQTKEKGDVYFVPVNVPDSSKTHGASSSDFKPLAVKKSGDNVIPFDLQRFRLTAEAPIYVDFKAIPYKDVEVLEWRERIRVALDVQKMLRDGDQAAALERLRALGVTHLVWPAEQPLKGIEPIYPGETYRLYRLDAGR